MVHKKSLANRGERVLIIISPYKFHHPYATRTELLGPTYLASVLRQSGYEVSIYDPTIEPPQKLKDGYYYGAPKEIIIKKIIDFDPDVVGICCHYSYSHPEAYEIARLVKHINSRAIVIMGGLFVSIYKDRVLRDSDFIDYGLIGEAENSLRDLLVALSSGSSVENIDGLIYRRRNTIVVNKKNDFIADLDSIPYPARDLVNIRDYMNSKSILYGLGAKPTLSLLTSRSCPYGCSYCNMHLVHGSRWRSRTPENVLGELDEIVNKYRAKHVFIMDDNFTFDIERAKIICDGIIRKKYKFYWNTPNGISVKKIDLELAQLMKKSGCVNVCIGIESGSEYIRYKIMNKNVSNEEIINAVTHFKKAGVPVGSFIILGMPGETEVHFRETVNFLKRLPLSFIVPSFAIPFPGTKLYDHLVKEGIIKSDFQAKIDNYIFPAFATKEFDISELMRRRKSLIYSFYTSHTLQLTKELLQGQLTWLSRDALKSAFRFLNYQAINEYA